MPSWTDRVLYATYTDFPDVDSESNITNILYTSVPSYTTSDHVCCFASSLSLRFKDNLVETYRMHASSPCPDKCTFADVQTADGATAKYLYPNSGSMREY